MGPAGGHQIRFTGVATASLSGHRIVTRRSDNTLEYASANLIAHLHSPLWLTLGAVIAGSTVEVLAYGEIDEPSWSWLPGPVFLGINGLLTQIIPTSPSAAFLAQVGVATGPQRVFIDRRSSISLV